ncbi:MAG: reverse transcriptase domain-containing protein [Pseudomonadales bacterium]
MEIYIPKSSSPVSSNIKDFRPIALLNVEGKLFFSLISKRLENHIIGNKLISSSIQKGCMEKVPGVWEHISMVWSSLSEARERKENLSVIWLDVANAYGSIPHKLIFFALRRYGVPEKWITIISKYYAGLWSKSFSDTAPSDWHCHMKGIFTGCTISIILFLSGMNIILEYTLLSAANNFISSSKTSLPLVRAFMDDLSLMSSSIKGTQDLLDRCSYALNWAGMSCRAEKSRSIVIVKGRSVNSAPFAMMQEKSKSVLPSIHSMPIKFLGRVIDGSLTDRKSIDELQQKLVDGLSLINKSFFNGKQKLWIMQNLLIPRIQWPLMIYEVPISFAIKLEKSVSSFIRKWLKLNKNISNIALYSSSSPCPLPIKSLSNIMKSAKISAFLLLRDSKDPFVSSAVPKLKSGSWNVESNVLQAEQHMKLKKIQGATTKNKSGLGIIKSPIIPKQQSYDYRKMVSVSSKELEEEIFVSNAVQLQIQGQWSRWTNYVQNNFSWHSLLATPASLISFALGATFDTLPSPSNLVRWRITTEASCYLCSKSICTSAHILSGCHVALDQHRYTFRHDSVLRSLASTLTTFLSTIKNITVVKNKSFIPMKFVKEGSAVSNSKKRISGILHTATDWKLIVDLADQFYIFPVKITSTSLRPDIVIFSEHNKHVILIELTCPCEENMAISNSKKLKRYADLKDEISSLGWSIDLFAIEVGARGYPSTNVSSLLKKFGFSNKSANKTSKNLGSISTKASFCIWLARNSREWNPNIDPIISTPLQNLASNTSDHQVKPPINTFKTSSSVTQQQAKLTKNFTTLSPVCTTVTGFVNVGNTCYANAMLQALASLTSLWEYISSSLEEQTPIVKTLLTIFKLKDRTSRSLDPSGFLWAIKNKLSSQQNPSFNFNSQHDVPEVLQLVLNEIQNHASMQPNTFLCSMLNYTRCIFCGVKHDLEDESFLILPLPVTFSIQESIKKLINPEIMKDGNKLLCRSCNSKTGSVKYSHFKYLPTYLIFQLNRFKFVNNKASRSFQHVSCQDNISLCSKVDESITFNHQYSLAATINHSGTLESGHYTSYVLKSGKWFHCNDRNTTLIEPQSINMTNTYVLFYKKENN